MFVLLEVISYLNFESNPNSNPIYEITKRVMFFWFLDKKEISVLFPDEMLNANNLTTKTVRTKYKCRTRQHA